MGLTVPNALVSKAEAAELLGCSERSVERKRDQTLEVAATVASGNGRRAPQFAVSSLPSEAQLKWLERNGDTLPLTTRLAACELADSELDFTTYFAELYPQLQPYRTNGVLLKLSGGETPELWLGFRGHCCGGLRGKSVSTFLKCVRARCVTYD